MRKKLISGLISLAMLLSFVPYSITASADSSFAGDGTADSPYLIGTAADLTTLANLTNTVATAADYAGKYYKVTADIDMTGVAFKPISYATSMSTAQGKAFSGTLDGDGHVIKNISFASIATYGATYGIIGYLGANGTVKNLGVENMTINGAAANRLCIGGIAGTLSAGVTIESCYVRGMSVKTTSTDATYTGGITGRTVGNSGAINNCYTAGLSFSLGNANYSGGIIGGCGNTAYKAQNCYTTFSKLQGWAAATNSYLGTTNCYYSSNIADATAEKLGSAFKNDSKGKNSGYPLLSWETEANFLGEGTEEKPYLINDANDLVKLATLTNTVATAADYANKYYKLTDDIDMNGVQYTPVSFATSMYTAQGAAFTGTFDGNNHIIKNVTMKTISTYGATYGIFGYLGANGVVKNLGVENMTVPAGTASRFCIGGIAGTLGNAVTIENSFVRGMKVTAAPSGSDKTTYVGGISGRTVGSSGVIKNIYTTSLDFAGVTNTNTTAGILGSSGNTGYSAENCYTTHAKTQGNTSATNSYMGATNCYTSGSIASATVENLGDAFKADVKGNNSGYPLLSWESEKEMFEGEGTEEKPFLIKNAGDMTKLAGFTNNKTTATYYANKYYMLTNDIDMSGTQYTAISFATNMSSAQGAAFAGTFDGNGHVIRNITMKTVSTYGATYGIFGYLGTNGTVKNLGVENMTVPAGTASRFCIGGIAGSLGNAITIENSFVRGMNVTAAPSGSDTTTYVGGIAGRTLGASGTIKNVYATSLDFSGVTNTNTTAGILGSSGNTGYKAENCYTTHAKVQANTSASNSYMGTTNCYSQTTITNATVSALGDAFKADSKINNGGYPLLSWEAEKEAFSGEGTAEKPYLIANATDLDKLSKLTNAAATAADYANKNYKLTADIDMTGVSYKPVSYATNMSSAQGAAFTGTLDGNGHVIKNVSFANIATYGATYGIIGYLGANGTVKNLGVESVTVSGGTPSRLCIGGIAGTLGNAVAIENSFVRGMKVTATPSGSDTTTYAGGIAGRTVGATGVIKNCYTSELDFEGVTNKNTLAGILGSSGNTGYAAENCYTTHAKSQGYTSATNTYMGTDNCYTSGTLSAAKTNIGLAFIADVDSVNNGNPTLVWEYEKLHSGEEKKTVAVNKTGDGTIEFAGLEDANTASVKAYGAQNVSIKLTPAESYVLTTVAYNGISLKANDGVYSFNVGDGGELKVVFIEITDSDVELFVSKSGNDTNSGTSASEPLKTIEAALNTAKAFNGVKAINLEEGVYSAEETIVLDSDDSGVVLRADAGAEVVLSGGKNIEKAWFTQAADNENILVADFKANGITEYGRFKSIGYGTYADSSDKSGSPVFTIDGEYQVPARYPNSGYIKTGQILSGADKGSEEKLSFKTSDSHASNWVNEKDVWVFGYFKEDWADANLSVTVASDGTITADGKSEYGAQQGSRFYVFNALSELDTEGEYYIDREEGKLYIYKPSNWDSVESLVFSSGDNNVMEINGAENVTVEGITIANTNANGLYAANANGLTVKNCNINNVGKTAVYVTASNNAVIEGNNVNETGFAGIIYVNAGDRNTLTSCNGQIKNNTITKTGLQRAAGAYAIDITNTVGAVVSGNEINNLPHGGILYMTCNDAVIEYNNIYDVIKDTSDAGAIYSGRNWTTRGNVIRYNYIHDIVDINGVNNASAVYLDDMHSSTDVYNNVIYKVPQAILLGGGRDNSFTNNLIIDCNRWIEADRRGTRTDLAYMKHMLSQVPYTSEAWSKYDNLANILEDDPGEAKYNVIKDNVTYNSSGSYFPITDMYNLHHSVGSPEAVTNSAFFYSYSDKEFGLSANAKTIDSAAYELIKDIPFAEMGIKTVGTFEVKNVEIKEAGENIVASVKLTNNTSQEVQTKLIIAQYNGDKLVMCTDKAVTAGELSGVTEESLTVAKEKDTTSYKVFLWDTNMKPLWK